MSSRLRHFAKLSLGSFDQLVDCPNISPGSRVLQRPICEV
jgi:hypothetical protein